MRAITTLDALVDDAQRHPLWLLAPPTAIVSPDGVFAAVNPAMCTLYGREEAELVGLSVLAITHPDELADTRAGLHALQDSTGPQSFATEKRYLHPDGRTLWVHVAASVARTDGGMPFAFITQVRDISRRRDAEDVLAALNVGLKDDAERSTQRLQSIVEEQRMFSYGVSHELRAPLRVIDGYARQLAKRISAETDGETHAMVERIAENSQRMSLLLDSLLELSRVGSVELKPESVDISLLADWVGAELIDFHPGREAQIDVQQDLTAYVDERKARILLRRVLENAWAFTPAERPVQIEVRGTVTDGRLHVAVRDHGRGIPVAHLDSVFEPFQRVHTPAEGAGSGMGLAIARRIVERHGGRIRVESVGDDSGSTVLFDLPAHAPDSAAP